MKAKSAKALLIAASLTFSARGFAQTKSKDAAAYANSGIAKLQKKDFNGAIADFNRALQLDPKLAKAYDDRGLAKQGKGDLDGAIADFNHALQLDPKDAKACDNRGVAKRHKGDFDGAIADFNRALQFDPKDAKAYVNRGIAKQQKGNLDGAIADFNRALQLNPKLANAYYDRADAKREKYDLSVSGAVDTFEWPNYDLGTKKVDKSASDGAIADINRALNINPKLAAAYASRGSANFLARNWTAALQDYKRFCELSPRSQQYARFGIWMIRSRLGEREAADKELAAQFNAK